MTDKRQREVQAWLAAQPRRQEVMYGPMPDETPEVRQARLFKGVLYELYLLIDEFGYDAVYFGVACVAFPDAVDPWRDGQY